MVRASDCLNAKVEKSQHPPTNVSSGKFADLHIFFRFFDHRQMWLFADLQFVNQIFFGICGLKTSASPHIFLLTNVAHIALIQICAYKTFARTIFRTVLT